MIKYILDIYQKHKSKILYLIFGGFTTLINIIVFEVLYRLFGGSTIVPNIIAWIASVIFAFVTNKLIVFESKSMTLKLVALEFMLFLLARVLTGAFDWVFVWYLVDVRVFNSLIIKTLSNVVVVVLNYIFSVMFIFKKPKI